MFIVKVKKGNQVKSLLWSNLKTDDFIRFLPKQFGVSPVDIEVSYIKNAWDEKTQAEFFMSDEDEKAGAKIEFVNDEGKVFLVKSYKLLADIPGDEATGKPASQGFRTVQELIKELETIPCMTWPYQQIGTDEKTGQPILKFLGNFGELTD